MDIVGTGKRVRIYVGELDRAPGHHEALWETILNLLRSEGAAGATMVRGQAGFGAHSKLHLARFADLVPDLPVLVEWIDGPERVDRLLPRIADIVHSGTITVEDVNVVKYTHRAPHSLPPDRVKEIMTRDVVSVHSETPVGEVVRLLLGKDFRSVPVTDSDNRLVGIVTNADLVSRGKLGGRVELLGGLTGPALEHELAASGVRAMVAADVMTREVMSVGPDEPLADAAHLMATRKIKRLPVVDAGGRLIGVLSRVDVLRTMGEDYHEPELGASESPSRFGRVAGDVMRTNVPSVSVDAPIGEVLDVVTSTRLNRAIVVDAERKVVGVISDADLLAKLDAPAQTGLMSALMGRGGFHGDIAASAADLMHTPPLTVAADTPLPEAAQRMLQERHKVLPITDADGHLVGVVDRADLLSAMQPAPGQ